MRGLLGDDEGVLAGARRAGPRGPAPSASGPAPSAFCATTVSSSPPAVRTRYWIETPEEGGDVDAAAQDVGAVGAVARPAGTSVIFSGRTPTRTASDAAAADAVGRQRQLRAVVRLDEDVRPASR